MVARRTKSTFQVSWIAVPFVLLVGLVLGGPAMCVLCLVVGLRAVDRSRRAGGLASTGEDLDAVIAAVLPAVFYGCAIWGSLFAITADSWTGWIAASVLASLVTLLVGSLPCLYIFGYSWGVSEQLRTPVPYRHPAPRRALVQEMLIPFRRAPHQRRRRSED
jgi:hypothetical protein